jgi:hypothetical protein
VAGAGSDALLVDQRPAIPVVSELSRQATGTRDDRQHDQVYGDDIHDRQLIQSGIVFWIPA